MELSYQARIRVELSYFGLGHSRLTLTYVTSICFCKFCYIGQEIYEVVKFINLDGLINFFRFPLKNEQLLKKWIASMKREKWEPKKSNYICSAHFTEDCLRRYSLQVRLKEDAVPTVFCFPPHLQKVSQPRRRLFRCQVDPSKIAAAASSTFKANLSPKQHTRSALQHHDYVIKFSPRGIKRKYETLLQRQRQQHDVIAKRLRLVRRQLSRRQRRLHTMQDIISVLQSRKDINAEAVDLIERVFGHIPAELLRRKLHQSSKESFSDAVRSFAMTLHFYSPKAYDFVRNTLSSALPHVSTLRRWCSAVEGKPGFTEEAFQVLHMTLY